MVISTEWQYLTQWLWWGYQICFYGTPGPGGPERPEPSSRTLGSKNWKQTSPTKEFLIWFPIGSMVLPYMVLHGSHQYTPSMLALIYQHQPDPSWLWIYQLPWKLRKMDAKMWIDMMGQTWSTKILRPWANATGHLLISLNWEGTTKQYDSIYVQYVYIYIYDSAPYMYKNVCCVCIYIAYT